MGSSVTHISKHNLLRKHSRKFIGYAFFICLLVLIFIYSNVWIKIFVGLIIALYILSALLAKMFMFFTDRGYKLNATFWEFFIGFIFFPSHYFIAMIVPFSVLIFFNVPRHIVITVFLLIIFLPPIAYFGYLLYLSIKDKKLSFADYLRYYFSKKYRKIEAEINAKSSERIEELYNGLDRIETRIKKRYQ